MMHHGSITRTNLDRGNPGVFFERTRNDELRTSPSPFAPQRDTVGHRDNDVGLNAPAVYPLQWLGLSAAFPSVAPLSAQAASVLMSACVSCRRIPKLTNMGICKPGRHLLVEHGGLDRLGPGTRAFVRREGHRRYAA